VASCYIPLFEFANNEWNEMGYNGTHSIPYHSIFQFILFSKHK